jgi:hypothetical protein
MHKNRLHVSKEKIMAATAVGLASMAFAGCGMESTNSADNDQGSKLIGACPKGYTEGQKIANDLEEARFSLNLERAVKDLAVLMPRNNAGYPALQFLTGIGPEDDALITAGTNVFHISDSLTTGRIFELNNYETKVDDPSEQFCKVDGNTYVAPPAATAVESMEAAGVNVESLPPSIR